MAHARIDTNPLSLREAVLSAMTPSEIHWIAGDRAGLTSQTTGRRLRVEGFDASALRPRRRCDTLRGPEMTLDVVEK